MRRAQKLVDALQDPGRYDHPVARVQMVETHLSWLLLTGRYAYKLKKPIRLPFVDFSTLEHRRRACEEEVRLNRRLAGGLYIGVVAIGGSSEAPRFDAEPAIEFAVKMREFPADARLDLKLAANTVDQAQFVAFAERMAEFHAALPPVIGNGPDGRPGPGAGFLDNLSELENELTEPERGRLTELERWYRRREPELEPLFAARRDDGFVRDGHGDLHLENLVVLDGKIVAFDALEFSRALRCVDVIDEIAFLTMDLCAHGRRDLGFVFLNRYLEVTGDYASLAGLRFYLIHRALVRAKVRSIRRRQASAEARSAEIDYVGQARNWSERRLPRLLITRGLSGCGKTSLARALVARLGCVAIRSDLERKRLAGLGEQARSGAGVGTGIYGRDATARTYAVLEQHAGQALKAGLDTIVDATFLERARRDSFRRLAERCRAEFRLLDCVAPHEVLAERVTRREQRGTDASEAGLSVLEHQIRTEQALAADEQTATIRIDTSRSLDLDRIVERIDAART